MAGMVDAHQRGVYRCKCCCASADRLLIYRLTPKCRAYRRLTANRRRDHAESIPKERSVQTAERVGTHLLPWIVILNACCLLRGRWHARTLLNLSDIQQFPNEIFVITWRSLQVTMFSLWTVEFLKSSHCLSCAFPYAPGGHGITLIRLYIRRHGTMFRLHINIGILKVAYLGSLHYPVSSPLWPKRDLASPPPVATLSHMSLPKRLWPLMNIIRNPELKRAGGSTGIHRNLSYELINAAHHDAIFQSTASRSCCRIRRCHDSNHLWDWCCLPDSTWKQSSSVAYSKGGESSDRRP